jgi:hypothetical protein
MSERTMTDAQVSRALRAHLPERASNDLRERILDETAVTRQLRPMPRILGGLGDADPEARRKALLVAAALLIGLTLAVSAGVGAWLQSRQQDDPFSLGAPPDVDRYVAEAYTGLEHLPALELTVLESEGAKARYFYNGAGVLRHEHFGHRDALEPEQYRIYSGDQMGEVSRANGKAVWVVYQSQPVALSELARATGLGTFCETPWTYVNLEYLLGRPTHHVACGRSSMWLDVETGIPMRSERYQEKPYMVSVFVVREFEIGLQPPELFEPPADLPVVTNAEFRCSTEPSSCAGSEPPLASDPPMPTPPPAPGDYTEPADLDAFVEEVVAKHATLGALEMTIATDYMPGGGAYWRHYFDGAGNSRGEWHYDDPEPPTIFLNLGGILYESYGLTDDGRTRWHKWPERQAVTIPDFGVSRRCPLDWEHHGFDLVVERPAHHLVCAGSSIWVDVEWLLAVRSQFLLDPLDDETITDELRELRLVQPSSELFVLPPDAVLCSRNSSGCSSPLTR